jgi:Uma2 family endonuclease
MKAVMADVSEALLQQRKQTGADQYDEMWDGVLHMPPVPNRRHMDLEFVLEAYLRQIWVPTHAAQVYHEINVAAIDGWPKNYRVPDLVILLPERYGIDHNEYFEGGPNVVVEIHSPGDEAYEKLPFYADLGVTEVWIIDRDTCEPEIYQLRRNRYKKKTAAADGWLQSAETGLELRREDGDKLGIRLVGDEKTWQVLPTD